MKIGIHRRIGEPLHTNSWSGPWEEYCKASALPHEVVDFLSPAASERIREFDIVLYHVSNAKRSDMLHGRSVLRAARAAGARVFPDEPDAWHFDDKVAQSYLLSALGAPIPKWKVFHSMPEYLEWLSESAEYPFIAKLKAGSGSHHVSLIETPAKARAYGARMFGPGIHPRPNLAFKARSNVLSTRSLQQMISRARRIPEFLRTRRNISRFDVEQGYVYVQEFIPNAGYDIKVAVVNGKVGYFARQVRPGDFRASGGGAFFYDRAAVPETVVRVAQETARKLGSLCMGFDFVVNSETGEPYIVEMSYGFSHRGILDARGHWDTSGAWVEEPLDVPAEIMRAIVADLAVTAPSR